MTPHGRCTDSSVMRSRRASSEMVEDSSSTVRRSGGTASGRPPLALTCPLFPWGTVRCGAVAGTTGQVPEQSSARELSSRIRLRSDVSVALDIL